MKCLLTPHIKQNPLFTGPFLADLRANLMTLRGANVGINGPMRLCLWLWKIRNKFWFLYNRNEIVHQLPDIFCAAQVSNHLANVDKFSLSGRSIWCLSEDMLGHKKAGYRCMDTIKDNKTMIRAAIFVRFDGWSGVSVRGKFGINGQDAVVILPSKVLTWIIIALNCN